LSRLVAGSSPAESLSLRNGSYDPALASMFSNVVGRQLTRYCSSRSSSCDGGITGAFSPEPAYRPPRPARVSPRFSPSTQPSPAHSLLYGVNELCEQRSSRLGLLVC
jgi:hypothetical protein